MQPTKQVLNSSTKINKTYNIQKYTSYKRALVISDIHIPYHNKDAVEIFIAYAKDNIPDELILLGDIVDFFSISRFEKDMRGKATFDEEIEETKDFLKRLRQIFPNVKMSFQAGNHSDRLSKYLLKNANALLDCNILKLENLLELAKLDIEYYNSRTPIKFGNLVLTHGDICRKAAGASARAMRDKYQSSICMGHIHRASIAYSRTMTGQDIMIENPCLSELEVDYGHMLDWINGFTELWSTKAGDITAHTHAIINNQLITTNGTVYKIEN